MSNRVGGAGGPLLPHHRMCLSYPVVSFTISASHICGSDLQVLVHETKPCPSFRSPAESQTFATNPSHLGTPSFGHSQALQEVGDRLRPFTMLSSTLGVGS